MYQNKRVDRSHLSPVTYDGIITGIYSDAQSRTLVEITIVIKGIEKIIKKQKYQLGFEPKVGQEVAVSFVPNKSGVFVNVYRK